MKRGDRFIKQKLTGWRGGRKLENTPELLLFLKKKTLSNPNLPCWDDCTSILRIHEMITANPLERIPTDLDSATPSVLERDILKQSAVCVFSVLSNSAAAGSDAGDLSG